MTWFFRPFPLALLSGLGSLLIGAQLALGANFGIPAPLAVAGLLWMVTAGLPTSAGVVLAAALWGQREPLTGLPGFLVLAAMLGIAFQVAATLAAARLVERLRDRVGPGIIRFLPLAAFLLTAAGAAVLWITYRPPPLPNPIVDGHAHLFGDESWPPVHKRSCGLSPAQKANSSYRLLMRLLRLPAEGDLNELYLEALVRQVREAQSSVGSFRVVLLAQDCRYTEEGEPDWTHSSVYVPNEYLFRVVERYPDLFIPCPSINPQRKDWRAELDYCLAQGARVLKIHPPTQAVNPGDPKFRAFYRWCAEAGMRVMVHTGSEHSAPIASATLGDPRLLELALDEGCPVIAAHAGTKAFFDPPDEDGLPVLAGMMTRYPRLHADTAVLGSMFRWRCVPAMVKHPTVSGRAIYGSDWPFPANALAFWPHLHPVTLVSLMAERNLFLRDLRLKQQLGLSATAFAGAGLWTTRWPPVAGAPSQ